MVGNDIQTLTLACCCAAGSIIALIFDVSLCCVFVITRNVKKLAYIKPLLVPVVAGSILQSITFLFSALSELDHECHKVCLFVVCCSSSVNVFGCMWTALISWAPVLFRNRLKVSILFKKIGKLDTELWVVILLTISYVTYITVITCIICLDAVDKANYGCFLWPKDKNKAEIYSTFLNGNFHIVALASCAVAGMTYFILLKKDRKTMAEISGNAWDNKLVIGAGVDVMEDNGVIAESPTKYSVDSHDTTQDKIFIKRTLMIIIAASLDALVAILNNFVVDFNDPRWLIPTSIFEFIYPCTLLLYSLPYALLHFRVLFED